MPTNENESNDDVDNGVKWLKSDRKPRKIQVESSGNVCGNPMGAGGGPSAQEPKEKTTEPRKMRKDQKTRYEQTNWMRMQINENYK